MQNRDAQADLLRICHRLYRDQLVCACAGNVSVRVDNTLLISASGTCLGEMTDADIAALDWNASHVNGLSAQPSSEWQVHQAIYQATPSIRAVVHAHPGKATALAIAGIALDQPLLAEALLILGPVPLIPYITPGSPALAMALKDCFQTHQAALLANHGVFTVGETLTEAFYRMELLEALSGMVIDARMLGNVNVLNDAQVAEVLAMSAPPPPSPVSLRG